MCNAHSYEQILCMYKQHLLIYEKQEPPAAWVVTSLGTSFTSGMSGLHLSQGGLDFIYIGEVWTSFTLGRSRHHLERGGLDFIYLGRFGLHLPWGGLNFKLIYLGEIWTSFTSGRSGLHIYIEEVLT